MSDMILNDSKVQAAESKQIDIVDRAHALVITNKVDLEYASALMQAANAILADIDSIFKEPTAKAYAAHRSIKAKWNELADPVKAAITTIKQRVAGYHKQLEAEAEAARRAEEERLRKQEEERRLAEAIRAEAKGETEKADALLDAPVEPARKPLITTPPPPKVEGIQKQVTYRAIVRNLRSFVEWCITENELRYLSPNQQLLDRLAATSKGAVPLPPGVEIISDLTIKSVKGRTR